ncbi:MFS transporter [Actinomadura rupiterrae]|uniref:MFS transporter n=1 Tax=Actinomadura rupiterrae TaxID=559627 RepID=UPI0020A5BD11|nr:MFS transporter [Actinomadura rupiterrae]MCP2338754.1 MFS family permease [Actinomadura rupiterrae]
MTALAAGARADLRSARRAVTVAFLVHGLSAAAWVARIPQIKEHLGLGAGTLGLALLGSPVGVVLATRVAGRTVARWGSRTTVLVAGTAAALAPVALGLSLNLPMLVGALVLLGASLGLMDVAMNAQGVAVERGYGRPIMSGLHGVYSIGTLVAAVIGSAAAHAHVPVAVHLSVLGLLLVALLQAGARALLDRSNSLLDEGASTTVSDPVTASEDGSEAPPASSGKGAGVLLALLGIVGLCSFVGEGAMADWSAVYLKESLGAGAGFAGLGYAGCAVAMTAGRLAGDRVVGRFGAVKVLRAGSLVACAGLAGGLAAGVPWAAVAGFTLFGLGVAAVAPVTFSAAGNLPGIPAAHGIARVTATGYLGLLGGPPVIGFVAQAVGLPWALAVPAALAGMIALLAGVTRAADR